MSIGSFACASVLCLGIVLPAVGQGSPAQTPAYLLRLERTRANDNACVLVRGDGQYHFERSTSEQTTILEGVVPGADLHQLLHWVGDDEFVDLTQDKIVAPIFIGPKDEFLLSVNRPEGWQNLIFPAPPTWQRYTRSVVPLARWLDRARKAKRPIRLREEKGRDYCTPPHTPELTTRSRQALVPFVFIARTTSFKGKDGEETCAVVYPDGRYHRETKSQQSGSNQIATAVFEGLVKAERLQALRDVLAGPDIHNRLETNRPRWMLQTDGEITTLTLPQEGKTRTILFWKYEPVFDLRGVWRVDESGMEALEPLRQWLTSNVDVPSTVPLAKAGLTDCVPPRQP